MNTEERLGPVKYSIYTVISANGNPSSERKGPHPANPRIEFVVLYPDDTTSLFRRRAARTDTTTGTAYRATLFRFHCRRQRGGTAWC